MVLLPDGTRCKEANVTYDFDRMGAAAVKLEQVTNATDDKKNYI